jgi:medium-chain acyl-[acyl-carrier-protein] hydrolase
MGLLYSALGGCCDQLVTREELEQWKIHTSRNFSRQLFPGNHFFIEESRDIVLSVILEEIEQILISIK